MATFVPTVTSDSNRKGVAFANNTGTISAGSTLDIVNDFTLSYAVKQLSNNTAHWCKGEPENPSIASGMIYTECKDRKLRVVIFDVNNTNVLSVITDNAVLASNKSKVIQIRYKQSTDLLEIFIDGLQATYTIETSEAYYHTSVSSLTGIDTNASDMTFGSASGKTDFDGILYGAVFDLEYLENADLNTVYDTLKDVVTAIDYYQQIMFVSNRDGTKRIYTMSEDGNDAIVFNNSFLNPQELMFSFNGTRIALNDLSTGVQAIDGDGNVLLTPPTPLQTGTFWGNYSQADINEYVYTINGGAGKQLYISRNNGAGVLMGNSTNIASPHIDLSGNYLYYINANVQIIRADFPEPLSNLVILYAGTGIYNMVVSKDNTVIAFSKLISGFYQVFTMGIGGGVPTQLTFDSNNNYIYDINSDSTKMVFGKDNGSGVQLYICNIDGTNQINISNNGFAYSDSWATFKPVV